MVPLLHAHFCMLSKTKQSGGRDEAGWLKEEERKKSTHYGVILPAVTGVLALLMAG